MLVGTIWIVQTIQTFVEVCAEWMRLMYRKFGVSLGFRVGLGGESHSSPRPQRRGSSAARWVAIAAPRWPVAVDPLGRTRPGERTRFIELRVPLAVVLQSVMPLAKVFKIGGRGRSTVLPVNGVVNVTPHCGPSTPHESTALVSSPQQVFHSF